MNHLKLLDYIMFYIVQNTLSKYKHIKTEIFVLKILISFSGGKKLIARNRIYK